MQYQHIGHKIKGFYHIAKYAKRYLDMITDKALNKIKVLQFWDKHGLEATLDAFPVKRRTLFLWKQKLKQANGKVEALNDISKRPHQLRKRNWSPLILSEIQRLRNEHPNLGKEKIYILLTSFCKKHALPCPKTRTIGRIIAEAPDKMRRFPQKIYHNGRIRQINKRHKVRKPKHFQASYPGQCIALDTVERFIDGCRRYIITFVDIYSRFSFAWATSSHSSATASKFFSLLQVVFPYRIESVLTDNGSEFAKHFDHTLISHKINHWHTYPRTPKMNAHEERFNRTIQEEFIDHNISRLIDVTNFNSKLIDYLLWYNSERPHFALQLKSPIQFLMLQYDPKCNMWWPNTFD